MFVWYIHVCTVACYIIMDSLVQFKPVTGDPDLIGIRVHCGSDIMVIRRQTHEMIWRSEPVRAVKTRRRFGPKTVSFHVSVYFALTVFYLSLLVSVLHFI